MRQGNSGAIRPAQQKDRKATPTDVKTVLETSEAPHCPLSSLALLKWAQKWVQKIETA